MGNAAAIAAAFGGGLPPGISGTNDRCTILVSNLNPDVSALSLSLSLTHTHTRTQTHTHTHTGARAHVHKECF